MPVTAMTFRTTAPRKKPREGDVKVDTHGRRFVRRQRITVVFGRPCYLVAHGRPVFHWVPIPWVPEDPRKASCPA